MCLDVVNVTRIRKKPAKLANNHGLEQDRSAKRYHYRVRGTRTSPLVKKAIPSATAP